MDAPAIAQAKALDSKSTSSAKSVEAALPADKTVSAKVTQVTPDKAQANSHKVKLEINNTLLQISAKFTGKPPELGSSVSITRSQSGQIQLSVNSDQASAKPSQTQPNTTPSKVQTTARALINNLSTPAPSTSTNTSSSQSVILKAPVIINASGESLAVIEKSLPKGQTLLAKVIDQSALANTTKQAPLPNPSALLNPSSNATNTQTPTQASTLANNPNTLLSQTLNQAQALSNNRVIANTIPNTASQNTAVTNTPTNTGTPHTGTPPTTTPTTNPQNSQAATPVLPNQAPALQPAPQSSSPSTLTGNTTGQAVNLPNQNTTAQPHPPSQAAAFTPKQVATDTYSIRMMVPTNQPATAPAQATSLQNAALPNPAPATSTASNLTPPNLAPVSSTPINSAAINQASNPSSSGPAPTSQVTPSPLPTNTTASNPAPTGAATSSQTTQVTHSTPTSQLATPAATPNTTATTPLATNSAPAQQGAPVNMTLQTTLSAPVQNTVAANPPVAGQATAQPTSQAIPQAIHQTTPQLAAAQSPAPQNAQLSALANPTATLKIAVAGREVSLQAPANLPELKNVQITRVQGVQANIQWQQASPPAAQPIQSLSNLTPKQATLVEQSLRQALPQQVPIAEGINQLVAQSAQLANTPGAVNTAVDKVALSIMQMFGVKPGANNSSDTIKRNVQQGGLFTEGKMLTQGSQPGDMKSVLSQLSKLADQLPTEQREMLQNTADRMLARVTTNQLTHVQQQHVKSDISNERSFQIDIPVQHNEKLDNVEMEIKQRKHLNEEGDFVSIWSVKLHFDLEERGEVDAEVALNPTDNSISTTFLCTKMSTVHEIEQRMTGFRSQLNDHGFDVQTLHCTQGSQAASANNPISKRIIDIRT